MATPKTLYKANGVEVKFIDTSPEVISTLKELSKSALGAAGKVIRKHLRENLPVHSNRLKNHIGTWKRIDKKTGQPRLEIGFYSWQTVKRKKKIPSHASPHWIEFGTTPHQIQPRNAKVLAYNDIMYGQKVQHPGTRATHILRNTVQNNIAEIRAAQEEYLKEINKTLEQARLKIDDSPEQEED